MLGRLASLTRVVCRRASWPHTLHSMRKLGAVMITAWNGYTYAVWGSKKDAYEINDRYRTQSDVELDLQPENYNTGTPHEFTSAYPTDKQIRNVLGLSPNLLIEMDGDDLVIYVTRTRDGYPI